ncbi:MAG: Type restriction-modification system, restriction subunit, partial [Labilithrix sp.]|nr:Type restriction-modification system, restriction subunit [Labilithrix sp.]
AFSDVSCTTAAWAISQPSQPVCSPHPRAAQDVYAPRSRAAACDGYLQAYLRPSSAPLDPVYGKYNPDGECEVSPYFAVDRSYLPEAFVPISYTVFAEATSVAELTNIDAISGTLLEVRAPRVTSPDGLDARFAEPSIYVRKWGVTCTPDLYSDDPRCMPDVPTAYSQAFADAACTEELRQLVWYGPGCAPKKLYRAFVEGRERVFEWPNDFARPTVVYNRNNGACAPETPASYYEYVPMGPATEIPLDDFPRVSYSQLVSDAP